MAKNQYWIKIPQIFLTYCSQNPNLIFLKFKQHPVLVLGLIPVLITKFPSLELADLGPIKGLETCLSSTGKISPKCKITNKKIKNELNLMAFNHHKWEKNITKIYQISIFGFQSITINIKVWWFFLLLIWFIAKFGYIFLKVIITLSTTSCGWSPLNLHKLIPI